MRFIFVQVCEKCLEVFFGLGPCPVHGGCTMAMDGIASSNDCIGCIANGNLGF